MVSFGSYNRRVFRDIGDGVMRGGKAGGVIGFEESVLEPLRHHKKYFLPSPPRGEGHKDHKQVLRR